MVTQEQFEKQNKEGRKAEKRVKDIMEKAGHKVQWKGDGARRDMTIKTMRDGCFDIVEVKNEDNYSSSGNICIEFTQGEFDKRSGILASESNVWIHTLKDRAVIYRRLEMLEYLSEHLWKHDNRPSLLPKSDNNNKGYILSIRDVSSFWWCEHIEFDNLPHSMVWGFQSDRRLTATA